MGGARNINGNTWLVIVNPNAGSRKGEKDWPKIESLLQGQGFILESRFTEERGHAISLVKEGIEQGYRKIIVTGGDGTLNEVVNGIFLQQACKTTDVHLGMIPVGTGNDWGRMYGLPKNYKKAIKVIKKERLFTQDAGSVTYHDTDGRHKRYFINVSGTGYDALVAKKTNRLKDKGKGSTLSYLLNIFTGLWQYRHTHLEIKLDGKEVFRGKVLSMNLGICRYNGNGMMQVPKAIPDDGLLDLTVIRAISKMKVIKHVSKLYDGSFIKLNFVELYRGKECSIISKPAGMAFLEADGESLGHSPLEFAVVPKSLSLIIPDEARKNKQ